MSLLQYRTSAGKEVWTEEEAFVKEEKDERVVTVQEQVHGDAVTVQEQVHGDAVTVQEQVHGDAVTVKEQVHGDAVTVKEEGVVFRITEGEDITVKEEDLVFGVKKEEEETTVTLKEEEEQTESPINYIALTSGTSYHSGSTGFHSLKLFSPWEQWCGLAGWDTSWSGSFVGLFQLSEGEVGLSPTKDRLIC
ncbi:uncharacterized protein LOC105031404 isoform X7 [Esox lucius]|uniref:uncharacterized protein LOC105031404 isoform X7 n=1 Tax=Esox lucius TaxID=8010 RepID=UPI0009731EC1|nr:uncharacterized protein LOC105031404 isoform X7 [Esox lucius]